MDQDTSEVSQQTGVHVLLDERDMRVTFVNYCRFHSTADEVVVDMGFNMPNPNPNPQIAQQQLLVKLTDRVIMSYISAKRLSQSLTQLIKRYEQQFGELMVPTQRQQPPR